MEIEIFILIMVFIYGIIIALVALFFRGIKKELDINSDNIPQDIAKWAPLARKYSRQYNVPLDIVLSVIYVESRGDQYARGSAGEWGLMQLKEIAVKDARENIDNSISIDRYRTDPEENIKAGTAFLSLQKKRTGNWPEALKAYNQGYQGKDIFPKKAENYLQKINEFRSII